MLTITLKTFLIGLLLFAQRGTSQPTRKPSSDIVPPSAPVSQTDAPVSPNDAPVSPTDAPMEASNEPVSPTDAPMEASNEPVSPTDAPVSPTDAPAPTAQDTDAPTEPPFDVPNILPTDVTDPPTVASSGAPVTPAPITPKPNTPAPSATPVETTDPPVTALPTTTPPVTLPPTAAPTTAPPITTAPVTSAPSALTLAPTTKSPTTGAPITDAPVTDAPVTDKPTRTPTRGPTDEPTELPTDEPSEKVPKPSRSPSEAPSVSPTTNKPTPSPLPTEPQVTLQGLEMTLTGLSSMGTDAIDAWEKTTETYIENFYTDEANIREFYASNVQTTVSFTNQAKPSSRVRVRRMLQSGQVLITFDQALVYAARTSQVDANTIVSAPFDTASGRAEYEEALRNSGSTELSRVTAASEITLPPNEDSGGGVLSNGAIAGIVVGGALGLMILMWGIAKWVKYRSDKHNRYLSDVADAPPTSINTGNDDVSAMDGYSKVRSSRESLAGYGDQSVATVDYDYSKAYGGGADHSVSSAGGTFGSNPNALGANQGIVASSFVDDGLFEAADENMREELIDIYAPAGKLGVVIDTPDDGAPVVHAIKDSSVIADKLQVGDKLVAVDDEDVRTMTAIKVSKLISRKSGNPTRKLSVIRTSVVQ